MSTALNRTACCCLLSLAGMWALLAAGPATAPSETDKAAAAASSLLGERFESAVAAISFAPPKDCKRIQNSGADELVEYINEPKSWVLRVTTLQLRAPTPLLTATDPKTNVQTRGLLDNLADQMVHGEGGQILRKDMITVGDHNVGMVVARFTLGTERWLRQQGLFEDSTKRYYIFNLTTPTVMPQGEEEIPQEKEAVATFNAMIDSIKVLDRSAIRQDQDRRLYSTRALFLDWTADRLSKTLKDKQYFLLKREGKNLGYSFMEEVPDQLDNDPGVNIYLRSRTMMDDKTEAEDASKMFSTFDRQHEKWAHVTVIRYIKAATKTEEANPVKDHYSEWGDSDYRKKRVFDPNLPAGEGSTNNEGWKDAQQPGNVLVGSQWLDVVFFGKTGTAAPVHIDVGPAYLPQGLGRMLPWLIPLGPEAKGYAFASYVRENHKLMMRYVDMKPIVQERTFNGKSVGYEVSDRLGLEGAPTVNYFTLEGQYLGSEDKSAKLVALPTDAQMILGIWPDAVLSRSSETEHRPDEIKKPAGGAGQAEPYMR